MAFVYWIAHPDHTDLFTQGYVGVTVNIKDRWESHKNRPQNAHLRNAVKKYGWDNLVKKVIAIADEAYCLWLETKLRAAKNIGWNIEAGGSKPPRQTVFKPMSEETKLKLRLAKLGKPSKKKGKSYGTVAWNRGLRTPDEVRAKLSLAKKGKKRIGKTMNDAQGVQQCLF